MGDTAGVGVRALGVGCLITGGGTVALLASEGGGATRTRLENNKIIFLLVEAAILFISGS